MTDTQIETIKTLQNSQKNLKIWLGTIMGIILILFFFTFALLVDKAPPAFFIVETIITLIIIPSFFLLNRISFGILKLTKGKKAEFNDIIRKLSHNDVDKKPEKIIENLVVK